VTDMRSMFYDCNNLTELDVSGFDTSKVTDMSYMFSMCTSLTSLTLWSDCSDSLRKELYEQTRSSALAG
ncbi:MAG: DUF285 domain-containing protein, partial [Lachnospiraceae bacterium]|nr:DUF285 domain-containing protein [Lachnospiraceae bacterium]